MHHIILGAGGIGGGIGARLVQAGHEVTFIARGDHLEAMQRDGLRLRTPDEDVTLEVNAVAHPSEVAFRGDEVVILAVKSQDTRAALEDLRAAAGAAVRVVCAQNGVANERMAARLFEHVYAMVVNVPATFLTPGEIRLFGTPLSGVLDAGRYPRGLDPTIEGLCERLDGAGFSARAVEDVMPRKYGKLLQNLANAVQALADTRDAPDLHRALRAEAAACFDAAGIEFVPLQDYNADVGARYVEGTISGEARGGGSTWQSLIRGSTSLESDYLNGEIALLGTLHGVQTPYNRALQELAAAAVRAGGGPGSLTLDAIEARARELGGA